MFTESPNLRELRQGDIIKGIYCLKLIRCRDLNILGKVKEETKPIEDNHDLTPFKKDNYFQGHIHLERDYSIVISQCCDLELVQGGAMKGLAIVISPLMDISKNYMTDPKLGEEFRSNDLEHSKSNFYIPQTPPLKQDYQVDFSRLISLHKTDHSFVRAGKVLQMDDATRVRFKIKLSQFFGRPTQEEIDSRIYPV